jgi:hypothetical protein
LHGTTSGAPLHLIDDKFMKLDKQSNQVLFLHLGGIIAGGLLGALLGNPNHIMLGISLGSFLGTLVPGLYAEMALRRKDQPNSPTHVCAAVFNNHWIKGAVSRPAVEEIRGQVYITWFGVMVGALIAGFAFNAALSGCLSAAALAGLLSWIASRSFSQS